MTDDLFTIKVTFAQTKGYVVEFNVENNGPEMHWAKDEIVAHGLIELFLAEMKIGITRPEMPVKRIFELAPYGSVYVEFECGCWTANYLNSKDSVTRINCRGTCRRQNN